MEENALKDITRFISVNKIVVSLVIVAVTLVIVKMWHLLSRVLADRFSKYRLYIVNTYPVAKIIIWFLAFYTIVVWVIKPPQATLIAALGSAGLALALGLQDAMKNVLAGIVLLFALPYRIGDMVRIGEHYGEVISIDLGKTRIRTFDDNTVLIPNAVIFDQPVANANVGKLQEMVVVDFTLPASVNPAEIKKIAWEAAVASPYAYLKNPVAVTISDRFDRNFLTLYTVKCYVSDVRHERLLMSDIMERIKRELVRRELIPQFALEDQR